ncbi:putative reverse transcriptase domain-containing protein [Tanacetum coccineum]
MVSQPVFLKKTQPKIEAVKNWHSSNYSPLEVPPVLQGLAEQEIAFRLLKQKLCVAPILALPEGSDNFMVYCDASIKGLGAILMQRLKVIIYAFRQLKVHEKNYTTHNLELEAVLLSDYDCEIRYHPGKANVVADALSQKERAQKEVVKVENLEAEDVSGMIKKLEARADGTLCLDNRSWLPCYGDTRSLWEKITMDFITKLPKTAARFDSIWVIVDCLTKSAHFLPMKETDSTKKLMRLYMKEIVSKRTIQKLEDMLRACVINFKNGWDRHLPLVEFSYNNSYHTSIKTAPYETHYERKCRSPICWAEVGDAQLTGPEIIHETTKKIFKIRDRMQAACDRQKSYADKRRRPLEFEVGDKVMLKVAPWKDVIRFGKRGKLNPSYIGPFQIIERISPVAY